jgi:hypothetical protein
MLPQQIATANYLDILFENKNKSNGAHVLRKDYARRLYFALLTAGMVVVSLVISFYFRKEPAIATSVIVYFAAANCTRSRFERNPS